MVCRVRVLTRRSLWWPPPGVWACTDTRVRSLQRAHRHGSVERVNRARQKGTERLKSPDSPIVPQCEAGLWHALADSAGLSSHVVGHVAIHADNAVGDI